MKLLKFFWIAPLIILSASCSTVSVDADKSGVVEADAAAVANCQFLRTISATSMFSGLWAGKALSELRSKIFREAEHIGATHVVLGQALSTTGNTTQDGKAYRCPAQ